MSSLWTPGGERPIRPAGADQGPGPPPPDPDRAPRRGRGEPAPGGVDDEMAELRRQLAETPAAVVVANHCFGLFELAALHLSQQPPSLDEAKLAIDGLSALVEGLKGRLGDQEGQLGEALAQLRLAFVQIRATATGGTAGG